MFRINYSVLFKLIQFQGLTVAASLLSALAMSVPLPDGVGLSHGGHGGYQDNYQPDPFHFNYGVHDDYHHTDFSEQRSGDAAGNIEGEYTVALPDGRIQHVVYHADGGYGGTVMEVTYKGEAHHPEAIHGGHGGLVGGHGGIVGGHGGLIGRL